MPDPNTEHGLRVQLATALRELDEARKACAEMKRERDDYKEAYRHANETITVVFENRVKRAESALAAARRECAKKDAALDRCHDLFSSIRGDWTDPRYRCREGMAIARAALAAPAAGEEGKRNG